VAIAFVYCNILSAIISIWGFMKLINQIMERRHSLFYFVVAPLFLIILTTGCLSEPSAQNSIVPQNSTIMPTLSSVLTPDPAENTPIMPVVQTTRQITSDDIKNHFLDIALGVETFGINKRIPKDISMDSTIPSDKELVQNFIFEFNDLSTSKDIFENIKTGAMGDLKIKFVNQDGMEYLPSNHKKFKSNNTITAMIDTDTNIIYVNSDLKGDQRNHTLLRSIYYSIGVKGDTLAYPDSLFYYDDNNNTKLTLLDKKAIEILFGKALWNGMSVDDIKQIIYLK
jgi:hypothetical protein